MNCTLFRPLLLCLVLGMSLLGRPARGGFLQDCAAAVSRLRVESSSVVDDFNNPYRAPGPEVNLDQIVRGIRFGRREWGSRRPYHLDEAEAKAALSELERGQFSDFRIAANLSPPLSYEAYVLAVGVVDYAARNPAQLPRAIRAVTAVVNSAPDTAGDSIASGHMVLLMARAAAAGGSDPAALKVFLEGVDRRRLQVCLAADPATLVKIFRRCREFSADQQPNSEILYGLAKNVLRPKIPYSVEYGEKAISEIREYFQTVGRADLAQSLTATTGSLD